MNWRWLFFDFIPPSLGLHRTERRSVMRRTLALVGNIGAAALIGTFFAVLPASLILTSILVSIWSHGVNALGFGSALTPTTLTAGVFEVLWLVLVWFTLHSICFCFVVRWMARPFVLRALNSMGRPICPHCDYELAELPPDARQCPECGTRFKPEACTICRYPIHDLPGMICVCPHCSTDLVTRSTSKFAARMRMELTTPAITLTRSERRQLESEIEAPFLVRRWSFLALLVYAVVAVLFAGTMVGINVAYGDFSVGSNWWPILLIIVPIVLAGVRSFLLLKPRRRALRSRGLDLCLTCGWRFEPEDAWLRRCPECGVKREMESNSNAESDP